MASPEPLVSQDVIPPKAGWENSKTIEGIRFFFIIFFVGSLVWMIVISAAASCGSFGTTLRLIGTCGLLSAVAMIVGGFFGFLFGIPRSLTGSPSVVQEDGTTIDGLQKKIKGVRANTNLEQISDWLTKILVGAGLTQVNHLPAFLGKLGYNLAPAFLPLPYAGVVALCIAGAFGMAGFMWSYFESRTSLMSVFNTADTSPHE